VSSIAKRDISNISKVDMYRGFFPKNFGEINDSDLKRHGSLWDLNRNEIKPQKFDMGF